MNPETRLLYEQSILGAVFVEPKRLPGIVGLVTPKDFLDTRCRLWFGAALALLERNEPIEIATLGLELANREQFIEAGGYSGLMEATADGYLNGAHLKYYVRELLKETRRIRLAELSARAGQGEDVSELLLAELQTEPAREDEKPETLGSVARSLAARSIAGLSLNEGCLPTPWSDLNDAIMGLAPGELTLVAARPGRGKTVFVTDIARHVAETGPVLFFSLEMNRNGITTRLLSSLSGVSHAEIRRGDIHETDKDSVVDAAERIAEMRLDLNDQGGLSIQQMRALAKASKAKDGLALVVVDYAQLASDPRADRRFEEMAAVSRGLKEMAKELRVPVLAAVQLNREGDGEKPRLSHIRECGQFEQDGDTILFLWMEDSRENEESPDVEVWIKKNRQGRGGIVKLIFQKSRCRMVPSAGAVFM